MVRGLFGGPRPLVSVDCLLSVLDYTAVPSPTISGGMSSDRTEVFRRAADAHLPVDIFTYEPHPMQPDLFGDVMIAELDTDRIGLDQYRAFVREYAQLLGTDDLQVVNTGIDARTTLPSNIPRPLADADVLVAVLVEISFPDEVSQGDIERVLSQLETELPWVADTIKNQIPDCSSIMEG